MRFLGILNYDRIFMKNLSTRVKPLYEIIDKNRRNLKWTVETEKVFDDIKSIWSQKLEYNMPNGKDQFLLETDASNVGIGAVLKQNDQTISYISRVLKNAEKNYSITERESLAALWDK
ncbi:Retrovirus-related Pol polyprotein from transposon 17.6 [Dictyocoela muelleri]|nr:Retrovirus-related Pol polyprotein from transposon 17.6 [Dictyocoela muelleri]